MDELVDLVSLRLGCPGAIATLLTAHRISGLTTTLGEARKEAQSLYIVPNWWHHRLTVCFGLFVETYVSLFLFTY